MFHALPLHLHNIHFHMHFSLWSLLSLCSLPLWLSSILWFCVSARTSLFVVCSKSLFSWKNIRDNRRCVLLDKELYDQIILINSLRCVHGICVVAVVVAVILHFVFFASSFLCGWSFCDLSKMNAMCCTRNAVADCTCASRLLIISFPLPFRRRFESRCLSFASSSLHYSTYVRCNARTNVKLEETLPSRTTLFIRATGGRVCVCGARCTHLMRRTHGNQRLS